MVNAKEMTLTSVKVKSDLFDDFHPTELSHQKWATYLKTYLNG